MASRILIRIFYRFVDHVIANREDKPLTVRVRRTRTMGKLLRNTVSYTVNFFTILLVLDQLGFKLLPLLAGAGVVGLAIGFGAQNLVRDVITGFFIIFEDQFGVGDVVQIGQVKGTVEEIGLRVTKIKGWTGEIHIIPNGTIQQVANFSIHNSVAVIDVSVAYEADIDKAIRVLKETAMEVYKKNEDIVEEPEVLGVQSLGASEILLRVTAECKPNTHFAAGRIMNEEIKKAFDRNGIEIPYPKMVTYHKNAMEGGFS